MATTTKDELTQTYHQLTELKKKMLELQRRDAGPVSDYEFRTLDGGTVKLSELFGAKDDLLVVHNMGKGCTYCTLWADGFVGHYPHLADRCSFVLCSGDDWKEAAEFSQSRKWNYPVVSGSESNFAMDMGFQDKEDKSWWPGVSAFHREADGTIVRTGWSWFGPGDDFCPVWPFLDLLKDGANGWEPKYSY